jgi:beta-glucosidase
MDDNSFGDPTLSTRVISCLAVSLAAVLLGPSILSSQSAPDASLEKAPNIFSPATASRAETLLHKMTTEEKLGQLTQLFVFRPDPKVDDMISTGHMGSALFVTDPSEINRLQHLAVEHTRLHIPLIFGFDVIHGFRTIFPAPLAMAATWDPAQVERAQTVAASEARSVGIAWAFAPMLDIARDPRWGRIVEGAGEDPYLGAAIAQAQVRGFQGAAIGDPDHVLACAKHFAGYGAAEGGRDYDASYISEAQLHNLYLPPFHAAVRAGVGSIMSAYMDLNDIPATGNKFLLHDVLREDWGFQGFVVSDANAVKSLENHGFARDQEDAAVRAFSAGVNMEMALNDAAYGHLQKALEEHRITPQQIDAAVLPILEAKIQLGLFEHPYVDVAHSQQVLADPAHRVESLHAAERSMVLLRNQGNLLPLSKSTYKSIAVLGPTGEDPMDMTGSWTFVQDNTETITILSALRTKLGSGTSVTYAPGVQISRHFPSFFDQIFRTTPAPVWTSDEAQRHFEDAVELARRSDLVVLTMGEHAQMSGEAASRSSLELPGDQERLIEAVAALGKPTVLVLSNGRPLNITWANEHLPAILEAWYPGTEGGAAVANLLFGDATPGGHLPLSWPRNVGQIPINYAHNLTQDASKQGERYWNEPSTPLYPFGYGLTYSTFAYSGLHADNTSSRTGSVLNVTVEVTNSGDVAADEVAQLYIHQQYGGASRPVRELKGFERLHLEPHARTTVHFKLGPEELKYWNPASHSWVEDPATFDLWAGSNSTAELHTEIKRTD